MKSKAKSSSSPSVSPARAAAFDILLRIERDSSYASELLHSRTYERLTTVDHSLATELVMGVLRWRSLLDSRIAENSSQPLSKLDLEILIALRLAVYQLSWLTRVPARAAINESVELVKRARKRSAASFVNAVLRKLAAKVNVAPPPQSAPVVSAETLAASSAHPLWLVDRWLQAYGIDAVRRNCEFDQSVPVTAIRMRNPEAESQLKDEGFDLAPGALLSSARRVLHGDITRSTAFRQGAGVIQDEASQLVAALVGRGTNILDCCAAPGGKTAAIADHNFGATIAAVELHPHRARLLRKLLTANSSANEGKTGNIHVVAGDAQSLPFTSKFDRVLADVPCSGTGTLARNPEIKWRLTPADLIDLQGRQVAILRAAMAQLAPGGRLIYSTCSLEKEENEDVIEMVVSEDRAFRLVECGIELQRLKHEGELVWADPSTLTRGPYLRTLPGTHPCDGFFAAILEKSKNLT
ncbi:MAG TPA: 16S rRNA (cytosine(967)-C(5))-methyltransferase RsmB [Candidatus Acidoferrum sp.]|nr:16S rRNA (cytosine(967)-C(5))-methyltransferase RsmB [Candidatus Acidoferrum sp.]